MAHLVLLSGGCEAHEDGQGTARVDPAVSRLIEAWTLGSSTGRYMLVNLAERDLLLEALSGFEFSQEELCAVTAWMEEFDQLKLPGHVLDAVDRMDRWVSQRLSDPAMTWCRSRVTALEQRARSFATERQQVIYIQIVRALFVAFLTSDAPLLSQTG